jgi:hypothetical protein
MEWPMRICRNRFYGVSQKEDEAEEDAGKNGMDISIRSRHRCLYHELKGKLNKK